MVFTDTEKISYNYRFFYLAHGLMSLDCLKGLIHDDIKPGIVIIHEDYESDKFKDTFYGEIESVCGQNGINLCRTKRLKNHPEIIDGYDIGICVGFMEIISEDIFNKPEYGVLNLHCGKLPNYRGRAPISRTIIDGNDNLTMTLHKIDSGVDSGDILLENDIPILPDDDVNSLYSKCSRISHTIVSQGIKKITHNKNKERPVFKKQENLDVFKPHRKLTEEELRIDWSKPVRRIHDLIRAVTYPYPCARTVLGGNTYLILKASVNSSNYPEFSTGQVAGTDNAGITVNCTDGSIRIYEMADRELNKIKPEKIFSKGDQFK